MRRILAALAAVILGTSLAVAIASPAHALTNPIGPVQLIPASSGKCLDVTGVSQANGALLQLYDCLPNQGNQQWYLYEVPGCFQCYQIVARHSGKCLDVVGASQQTGAAVQQYDCLGYGQTNQIWGLTYYFGGSYFVLYALHSGKQMTHGGAYNGSPVYQASVQQYWIWYAV